MPQLFGEKFHLNSQQLGLQFVSIVIGSIIGKHIGGHASDMWMQRRAKRVVDGKTAPEFRLWLSYLGYALAICGTVVFLVRIEQALKDQ
jgi:hypothetical protein